MIIARSSLVAAALCALVTTAFAQADNRPEFRLGTVVSVTGGASAIAVGAVAAMNLLEERLAADKALPFRVRFIKYDDGSDPAKSVNLVRKLAQEDKAHLVICCTTTPSSLAVNKVVDEEKVPNISVAAAAAVIEPAAERKFTFKTPPTDRLMINHTLDYLKKKGATKVAFMGLEDSYGEGGWVEFNKLAREKGFEIVAAERFARADTNFTPQALRVAQKKPDAVYFHAIPPSAALAHETLKRVGYEGLILHGAGSSNPAFLSVGKKAVEGGIVGTTALTVHKDLPANHPLKTVLTEFVKTYDTRYGEGKADLFAAQTYDAVMLAVSSWRKLSAADQGGELVKTRALLRDQIEGTRNYLGTVGIFNFSPTDHLGLDSRSTLLVVVKDGKFALLEQ